MSPRPYLLLGQSDHRALAERVDAALAAWQREWLADGAPDPVFSLEAAPRAERAPVTHPELAPRNTRASSTTFRRPA